MIQNRVSSLVVIDPAIKEFYLLQKCVENMIPESEVLVLQPDKQEIKQITLRIQKYIQIKDIHIISQGYPGYLYLGNSSLSINNFNYYSPYLKKWSVSNIYLYGCNVGSQNIGKRFILRLYKTTGAKIYTLDSPNGTNTKVGVGIWTTSEYMLINPKLTTLMV